MKKQRLFQCERKHTQTYVFFHRYANLRFLANIYVYIIIIRFISLNLAQNDPNLISPYLYITCRALNGRFLVVLWGVLIGVESSGRVVASISRGHDLWPKNLLGEIFFTEHGIVNSFGACVFKVFVQWAVLGGRTPPSPTQDGPFPLS